jgi:hypothetical protein
VNWKSIHGLVWSSFTPLSEFTLFPVRFYCKDSLFVDPSPPPPTPTVIPAEEYRVGLTSRIVIEDATTPIRNRFSGVHGSLEMTLTYNQEGFQLQPTAYPAYFFTSVTCQDWSIYADWYLEIQASTTNDFTVILNQHTGMSL